ncbi:MAG TPA: hypothetical protein VJ689_00385, partial [Gaiellaceae bacterium]|nr:hypothetical protein [Gaiellaceae bacterium]
MTAELLALALANLAYLLLGCALFVVTGAVDQRRETWPRLGAAYLVGVAAVVIPASYLALLGVGLGWTAVAGACGVAVAAAALRLRRDSRPGS